VQRVLIIVLVVLVVLGFMTTYTVRFTETAVVTTFGRADEEDVKTEAGLYFKVPYVQRVTTYDRRVKFLENRAATQQTADQRQVVVTTYMTWRVSNPLAFFQRFSNSGDREADHYKEAEKTLREYMSSAMSAFGKYRLDELVDTEASQLARLEQDMLAAVRGERESATARTLADYGIEPVTVAVSSLRFPQETSKAVFERMKTSRQTIANESVAAGASQAETIRKSAEADAQRILAFADRLAGQIRSRGVAEAAQYTAQMREEPQLAVFLKQMDFLRTSYGKQATLVLGTSMPGMDVFRGDFVARMLTGKAGGMELARPDASAGEPAAPAAAPAGAAPSGVRGEAAAPASVAPARETRDQAEARR